MSDIIPKFYRFRTSFYEMLKCLRKKNAGGNAGQKQRGYFRRKAWKHRILRHIWKMHDFARFPCSFMLKLTLSWEPSSNPAISCGAFALNCSSWKTCRKPMELWHQSARLTGCANVSHGAFCLNFRNCVFLHGLGWPAAKTHGAFVLNRSKNDK